MHGPPKAIQRRQIIRRVGLLLERWAVFEERDGRNEFIDVLKTRGAAISKYPDAHVAE